MLHVAKNLIWVTVSMKKDLRVWIAFSRKLLWVYCNAWLHLDTKLRSWAFLQRKQVVRCRFWYFFQGNFGSGYMVKELGEFKYHVWFNLFRAFPCGTSHVHMEKKTYLTKGYSFILDEKDNVYVMFIS